MAIICGIDNTSGAFFFLHGASIDGEAQYNQVLGEHRFVRFDSNGNFVSRYGHDASSIGCHVRSIKQLIELQRAIFLQG